MEERGQKRINLDSRDMREGNGQKKTIKGIRIRSVNLAMIVISCFLYIFLISVTVHLLKKYEDMHDSMDDYIACVENDALLTEASAYLTEQVRLYVITSDLQYMENYFTEVNTSRRRQNALEYLENSYSGSQEAYDYLREALEASNQLMVQEIYAMKLIAALEQVPEEALWQEVKETALAAEDLALSPEETRKKAQSLVFGEEYQRSKEQISESVSNSMDSIYDTTHQTMLGNTTELKRILRRQGLLISILFIENVITFILITLLIIKPLQVYVKCIREDKMLEITGSYEFKYLALTYNDIYEVNAANEAMLRYRAEHDPLTGLMNRGAFEQMKKLFMVRPAPIALMIIDVDKFKQVNDGYGHEVGDRILQKVARLLVEKFRTTDYPARIGGDEFAVILTRMTEGQNNIMEEKILEINNALRHPTDGLPEVSLSVGAAFSEQGFTEDLYHKADTALYAVKENGRCGYQFYKDASKIS